MNAAHALLTDQFLAWVADRPRDYRETMAAWRSSCPRLSVWEDSLDASLVRLARVGPAEVVQLTEAGAARLRAGP